MKKKKQKKKPYNNILPPFLTTAPWSENQFRALNKLELIIVEQPKKQ